MDFNVVGMVPSTFTPPAHKPKTDYQMLQALSEAGIFPKGDFAVCPVTSDGMMRSLNLYNHKQPLSHDEGVLKQAVAFTERMYSYGPYNIKHPQNVEIKEHTQPGYPWSKMVSKKGDVLANCRDAINSYVKKPSGTVLWTAMGKMNEILPMKKVKSEDCRTLIYPPVHFLVFTACFFDEFDDMLKSGTGWSAFGFTPQHGGYNELFQMLDKYIYKGKGDISKFDRSIHEFLDRIAMDIRRRTSSNPSDPRWNFLIENTVVKWVILPNGLVVIIIGMASGRRDTTGTNTLVHTIVQFYHCIKCYRILGYEPTYEMIVKDTLFKNFADDHVFGTNIALIADFETRKKHYAELGFTLKAEDDLETDSALDLTFLGGKATLINGQYVPMYNKEKIFDILSVYPNLDSAQAEQRFLALMRLACADESAYLTMRSVYHKLYNRYPPSRQSMLAEWMGSEVGSNFSNFF